MAREIEIHHSLARVLDARREGLGDFEERLLRGALARGVAAPRDQLRKPRARLGQRHARLDPDLARLARRGRHARGGAVALADGDGLLLELGLAAQARGEGKERDEDAGDQWELAIEDSRAGRSGHRRMTPGSRRRRPKDGDNPAPPLRPLYSS